MSRRAIHDDPPVARLELTYAGRDVRVHAEGRVSAGLLKRMLAELEKGPTKGTGASEDQLALRKKMTEELIIEESKHEALEEMYFWPTVREHLAAGNTLADTATRQEQDAKHVLADLDKLGAGDLEFEKLLGKFIVDAREHIAFEETQVWPGLRTTWSTTPFSNPCCSCALGRSCCHGSRVSYLRRATRRRAPRAACSIYSTCRSSTTARRLQVGCWRNLYNLLVPPLHRTVALKEMNRVALPVGQNLHLDVTGSLEETLNEYSAISEGRLGLADGTLKGVLKLTLLPDNTHPTTATAHGSRRQPTPRPWSCSSTASIASGVPDSTVDPELLLTATDS